MSVKEKNLDGRSDLNLSPRRHVLSPTWISISSDPVDSRGFESDLSFLPTPMSQHLWLRCEKKEFERRSALSPKNTKALIGAGFTIHVERDEQRIFDDLEYESYAHTC